MIPICIGAILGASVVLIMALLNVSTREPKQFSEQDTQYLVDLLHADWNRATDQLRMPQIFEIDLTPEKEVQLEAQRVRARNLARQLNGLDIVE